MLLCFVLHSTRLTCVSGTHTVPICQLHTHSTRVSATHSTRPCVLAVHFPFVVLGKIWWSQESSDFSHLVGPYDCAMKELQPLSRFLTVQPSACHSPWLWIGAIVRFWQLWKGVIIYMHKNTYLLAVLRIEHMAPHMLGKHSTATPASMLSVYLGKNH